MASTTLSSMLPPPLMTAAYGLYADWSGLDLTFAVMAMLTLAVIPLSIPLRARLAAPA